MELKEKHLIAATILIMLLFANLFAQAEANWIRKTIRPPRGGQPIFVRGIVEADKTVIVYVFRARKNQQLTARISSANENAKFCLLEQDGDPAPYTSGVGSSCAVTEWTGILMVTTPYEMTVTAEKGKTAYMLEIRLK